MSEWITDRRPTAKDADDDYVWVTTDHGNVLRQRWEQVGDRPWMPMTRPEPYVKPKRYQVSSYAERGMVAPADGYRVYDAWQKKIIVDDLPKEAAQRIAAIYEELMP